MPCFVPVCILISCRTLLHPQEQELSAESRPLQPCRRHTALHTSSCCPGIQYCATPEPQTPSLLAAPSPPCLQLSALPAFGSEPSVSATLMSPSPPSIQLSAILVHRPHPFLFATRSPACVCNSQPSIFASLSPPFLQLSVPPYLQLSAPRACNSHPSLPEALMRLISPQPSVYANCMVPSRPCNQLSALLVCNSQPSLLASNPPCLQFPAPPVCNSQPPLFATPSPPCLQLSGLPVLAAFDSSPASKPRPCATFPLCWQLTAQGEAGRTPG